MTAKRYLLVKCILNRWGIVDKTLDDVDQLLLTHPNKLILNNIVNELNEKEQLKEENNKLKQQFILILKKLGKKNPQCNFCEYGEYYTELEQGYYEHHFRCNKKGQEYTQRNFCEDWKIKVKE